MAHDTSLMAHRLRLPLFTALGLLLITSLAAAQEPADEPEAEAAGSPDPAAPEGEPSAEAAPPAGDAQAGMVADAQAGDSPAELPNKTYQFVGLRYRAIIMPKFMQNLFAEGGRTVLLHGVGPEFGIRKNGFEYSLSPWLAFYSMEDTAFKGSSDPVLAWELVRSDLKVLYLTSDFLWSHEFSPEFALNYGMGAGFGFVFGDLFRNQTYPTALGQNPDDYSKCPGPDPTKGGYCDTDNKHYGNYTEPGWASGGSKPLLFPWLTLQTGLRFKPSRSFASRLDVGFGTSGFFLGIGADYGL